MSRKAAVGAQSTTTSDSAASSAVSTIGTGLFSRAIAASARARFPAETAASVSGNSLSSIWRATTRPMVPKPAIPTFVPISVMPAALGTPRYMR